MEDKNGRGREGEKEKRGKVKISSSSPFLPLLTRLFFSANSVAKR
jgi:hypothetical protein